MKIFFTSLSLLIINICFAQGPQIKGRYLPVAGTKIKQVYEKNNPAMGIPASGATPQLWDYSNKFVNPSDTFVLATFDKSDPNCNCSQYLSFFPTATHVSFLRAPFPLDDSTFTFFRIDTNGIWAVGAYTTNSLMASYGIDTAFIAIDDELFTPSNPAYGGLLVDSSRYLVYPGLDTMNVRQGIKKLEGIGYGTLITPVDTFDNVLLAKETNIRFDTILGSAYPSRFDRYIFLRNNTFGSSILLMQQMLDTTSTALTNYAWYTLPVDFGTISGTVYENIGGTAVTSCPGCKALLYRENSTFSVHDILDVSDIDINGNYLFDSIPYGTYLVAIRPDTAIYSNALTTFYGDTTNWLGADTINTLACQCNTSGRDISLQYIPAQSNSVLLSGSITLIAPFWKNGPAIPSPNPLPFAEVIPGVDIIVKKTPGGKAMAESQATGSGNFVISNLQPGTYEIHVDIPGLFMANTYTFTVVTTVTNSSLDFFVGEDSIYTTATFVGLNEPKALSYNLLKVFPNPASNNTTLQLGLHEKSSVLINVYNTLGAKCLTIDGGTKEIGIHNFQLDMAKMPSGLYFVMVNEGSENSSSATLIKD